MPDFFTTEYHRKQPLGGTFEEYKNLGKLEQQTFKIRDVGQIMSPTISADLKKTKNILEKYLEFLSHSVFIKHLLDIELNSREQIQLRSLIKEFTNYEKELKIVLQRSPDAVAAAITNQITELQKRMLKDISELDEFCLGELDVVYFYSTIKTMINTFKNTKFFIDSLERILGDKIGQDTLRLDVSCLKEENIVLSSILPILRQFGVSSLKIRNILGNILQK